MHLAFFEDQHTDNLSPIALLRPVFELVCGRYTLRERLLKVLSPRQWGAVMRDTLREIYLEEHPHSHINNSMWLSQQPTLLINGRWLPSVEMLQRLRSLNATK